MRQIIPFLLTRVRACARESEPDTCRICRTAAAPIDAALGIRAREPPDLPCSSPQTTAASTAKHQAAVVLHHRQPQSTETIMAVATLTLPDRSATLPVPAAPASDAHHPRARPRHHHRLGAACARRPDHQRHGVVPAQPLRRRRHALPALHQLADRARPAERADRRDLVRGGAPACRHRRRARLRRADGDADRLGRAPRRALPGRAGRHDQAPRHRQGQRRRRRR